MNNKEQKFDLIMENMKVAELKEGFSIFGNKGAVWTNNCHISQSGNHLTLCNLPKLSNNWAKIEEVKEIRCIKCQKKYKILTNE
jgi:hypothetical protein